MALIFYFLMPVVTLATSLYDENSTSARNRMNLLPAWLPRSFRIICCSDGYPTVENPEIVKNFTQEVSDYPLDEHFAEGSDQTQEDNDQSEEESCRTYQGTYLVSAAALFSYNDFAKTGIICKCPSSVRGVQQDKNCRRLSPCKNNGYRSFSTNYRCSCPKPFFGAYCEKYCDQGQRLKGNNGEEHCACVPFYEGEECKQMVCLNGGTAIHHRCLCPPNFLGFHCEIVINKTVSAPIFHKYSEQGLIQDQDLFTRDISGTIFSLMMIIVLVVSMYLLMKHRMQVHNRITNMRRDPMSRSGFGLNLRRSEIFSHEESRIVPFRIAVLPSGGPPPYIAHSHRERLQGPDALPPLPTYEDATKFPSEAQRMAVDTNTSPSNNDHSGCSRNDAVGVTAAQQSSSTTFCIDPNSISAPLKIYRVSNMRRSI